MINKRLSNSTDYDRPDTTITETIQNKKDIEEQLKDFEEIENEYLYYTPLNTYLKYLSFNPKTKKELFRFGGLLVKIENEYVVLSGKQGMRFSVQRYTKDTKGNVLHITRFFKKINPNDILMSKIEEVIDGKDKIIDEKDKIIRKQQKEIIAIKKKLK
jgi:hypothetical protein